MAVRRTVPTSIPTIRVVKGRTMACVEFDLKAFGPAQAVTLAPQGVAPAIERDVTIELPKTMTYHHVEESIHLHRPQHLISVTAINLFMVEDTRRLTLRLVFQDIEQTLTADVVEREVQKVSSILSSLGVSISV
jgi:phenylalanyl-tRNA synthetase beta subunit